MTRFDAVNYISHGIAKVPGRSESRTVHGSDEETQSEGGTKQGREALGAYCVDLNEKARQGKIDPLIGRESEVERTIQILCRRQKNNPLYVGDPGVGKTAIAEGLARRIVTGDVPEVLKSARIFALDMGALARRHALSRRFRGAAQGGALRARPDAGRGPVHRRDPHGHRRRRHLRRLDGCVEPAEAGARLGHAALHRLDDLQGVPQLLREGPGARPPLPEDRRQRADGRGHGQDPARPQALLREAPSCALHRRGDPRRGRAVGALHQRPQAARQGDRRDRRGRRGADAAAAVAAQEDHHA